MSSTQHNIGSSGGSAFLSWPGAQKVAEKLYPELRATFEPPEIRAICKQVVDGLKATKTKGGSIATPAAMEGGSASAKIEAKATALVQELRREFEPGGIIIIMRALDREVKRHNRGRRGW